MLILCVVLLLIWAMRYIILFSLLCRWFIRPAPGPIETEVEMRARITCEVEKDWAGTVERNEYELKIEHNREILREASVKRMPYKLN